MIPVDLYTAAGCLGGERMRALLVRTGCSVRPRDLFAQPLSRDDLKQLAGMAGGVRHLLSTQVFSGADVRGAIAPGTAARRVRDVMSRQVMCVAPEQPIAEVASLMSNKDVDRVPVVREGQLVGFLTRGDIVRKLIGN